MYLLCVMRMLRCVLFCALWFLLCLVLCWVCCVYVLGVLSAGWLGRRRRGGRKVDVQIQSFFNDIYLEFYLIFFIEKFQMIEL